VVKVRISQAGPVRLRVIQSISVFFFQFFASSSRDLLSVVVSGFREVFNECLYYHTPRCSDFLVYSTGLNVCFSMTRRCQVRFIRQLCQNSTIRGDTRM
jgi:hypothetical protein